MSIEMIPSPHGDMPAYVAHPEGEGPWPAVVVIHDVFGLGTDLKNQCEWLASSGFLAIGPDLYHWGRKIGCVRSTIIDLRARRGRAFDDIEAARSWITSDHHRCNGSVGVIGYCMGGGFSLLLAPGHGYAASSVNYGEVPKDVDQLLVGACPIIGSFGARDRQLAGAAIRLEEALCRNSVPHDVVEYPDAGHSFLNHHDGRPGVLMAVAGRLFSVGYHEPSAADARRRIVEFFDQHLRAN